MIKASKVESEKRDPHIKHHFEVNHLTKNQRDSIGFLGEFACCELFNIDWKKNIRENYYNIDDNDIILNNLKIDVKTETVPLSYAKTILNNTIKDNKPYGMRLINKGQFDLLKKYDHVIFGLMVRGKLDYWYPIGCIDSNTVLKNFKPTYRKPYGGQYPFPASRVPNSILKPLTTLL